MNKNILLLVDPLNDFADPKGSLYVPDGERIIPVLNELMEKIKWDEIILIQDWHPLNHKSFATNNDDAKMFDIKEVNGIQQVMWPVHCVQESWGSEPHPDLEQKWTHIVQKGMNPELDSYSAFYENDGVTKTGIFNLFDIIGVDEEDVIYVTGLATDYCVKYTAIDATKHFKNVVLIEDAIEGINKDDIEKSLREMFNNGVNEIDSDFLINELNN